MSKRKYPAPKMSKRLLPCTKGFFANNLFITYMGSTFAQPKPLISQASPCNQTGLSLEKLKDTPVARVSHPTQLPRHRLCTTRPSSNRKKIIIKGPSFYFNWSHINQWIELCVEKITIYFTYQQFNEICHSKLSETGPMVCHSKLGETGASLDAQADDFF